MADDKDYAVLQAMIEPLTQGVNAIATRPQKTFQSVTSTPYALADLEEARNQIGLSTKELNDVLKGREQLGYSLANTLANMPQQQGYGSWLTDFARGFGMGASAPANARMARQQQIYDAQMTDLANRLAFDKAMGETQVSRMDYTPFATGKDDKSMNEARRKQIQESMITSENLGDLFQTINAYPMVFSTVGGLNQTEQARGLRSGVTSEGVTDLGHKEFAYLNSMMPNGFATAINTAAEQRIMRPYTTEFERGAGSAKKASIKNMLGAIYDEFARDVRSQGYEMPLTKEQYINQRINAGRTRNPDYYVGKSDQMYLPNKMTPKDAQPKVPVSQKYKIEVVE